MLAVQRAMQAGTLPCTARNVTDGKSAVDVSPKTRFRYLDVAL